MKLTSPTPLRVMLYDHETLRLPSASQRVRVKSGRAWVTVAGRDVVLACGETLHVKPHAQAALVSALSRVPLILEIVGEKPQRPFSGWPDTSTLSVTAGR